MSRATSLTGYKHTDETKLKVLKRYETKSNHPMYGKKHRTDSLALISKLGEWNPMFGKLHSSTTKEKISDKISKHVDGIGIYDLNDNLISKFKNNVELAKHLSISRVTVGKYLNSGLVYYKMYRFKINNK
jgi:group I intron endonuclease